MMKRALFVLFTLALAAPVLAAETAAEGHGQPSLFSGDIGNAIWTVVIFLCVLFVLKKFAWGPILSTLQARETFLHDKLAAAKRDRDETEALKHEYEARLAQARVEASAIVEEGRRDAVAVKQRIEADARAEAEKILERARREIHIATETATKELYQLSARQAIEMASRVIGRELTPQDHERLISGLLESRQA